MNNNANDDARMYAQIRQRAARFSDRDLAFGYSATTTKPTRVMLGDDQMFWVVRPVDANRMERLGYEYAS